MHLHHSLHAANVICRSITPNIPLFKEGVRIYAVWDGLDRREEKKSDADADTLPPCSDFLRVREGFCEVGWSGVGNDRIPRRQSRGKCTCPTSSSALLHERVLSTRKTDHAGTGGWMRIGMRMGGLWCPLLRFTEYANGGNAMCVM